MTSDALLPTYEIEHLSFGVVASIKWYNASTAVQVRYSKNVTYHQHYMMLESWVESGNKTLIQTLFK